MVEAYRQPRQYAIGAHIGRESWRVPSRQRTRPSSARSIAGARRLDPVDGDAEERGGLEHSSPLFMSVEESIVILAPSTTWVVQGVGLGRAAKLVEDHRETVPRGREQQSSHVRVTASPGELARHW